jgi:hypothetical protein
VKDATPYNEFAGPRAVEFRFRFASEIDANNFADSFDDNFAEIDSVAVTCGSSWVSSAIAPTVHSAADVKRLNVLITAVAVLHHGESDGLFFFD